MTNMIEYGYVKEGGYLVSKNIEEYSDQHQESGEIEKLAMAGWKPVDALDESRLQCNDGHVVRIIPFDAGDRISYRYETVFDTQKVRREIEALKKSLADDDYKVTKCYEVSLLGEKLPYDITILHRDRQKVRNKINELENTINTISLNYGSK